MKYGTGAPGQVGWAVDFQEILLRVFLGRFLLFLEARPPQKNTFCRPPFLLIQISVKKKPL